MADNTKRRITGLRRNQQLLYVGLFTLVVVVVWIATSLFSSQQKTGISSELRKMAVPLNPNINTFVIERLEAKRSFSPEELSSFEVIRFSIEEENRARAELPTEPATVEPTSLESPPILPL